MIRHVMDVQELMTLLSDSARHRPPQMGINDLKVRIATGLSKEDIHLIESVYYSPETQSVIISTEK